MIVRFLSTALLFGHFTSAIAAEPTHDPRINSYLSRLHLNLNTMQNQIIDLDNLQLNAKELIETHSKAKKFSEQLELLTTHLNETKQLSIQANSTLLSSIESFVINAKFAPLNQTLIHETYSLENELTAVPPFITCVNFPDINALASSLTTANLLTQADAMQHQIILDNLLEKLGAIKEELAKKKEQAEIDLNLNSNATELTRGIVLNYMNSGESILKLIRARLTEE